MLANRFVDFFCQKIAVIRNDLFVRYTPVANSLVDAQACSAVLTEFERMTEAQVKSLINSCRLKTCILDPLPASIMKDCTNVLLPVLTKMINISIETANVPVQLKEAMIRPKLKKKSLDHEVYSNFRPISNLKLISKMIEKAISYQITNYLRDNDLEESLQSAYKTFHSTETALVKVHNDIVSRLTISPILFYYSLTYLQLLTLWITRFFCRDSLVALVLMAKPCAGLSPTLRIVNK